jgi:hypothetical protein
VIHIKISLVPNPDLGFMLDPDPIRVIMNKNVEKVTDSENKMPCIASHLPKRAVRL